VRSLKHKATRRAKPVGRGVNECERRGMESGRIKALLLALWSNSILFSRVDDESGIGKLRLSSHLC